MSSGYDTEKGQPVKSNSRPIVFALLGAAVVIGIGLAVGLWLGLRLREVKPCELPSDIKQSQKTCDTPSGGEQGRQYKSGHGEYRFATVAADSALCSKIGTEIMGRKGGNAADAAIATVICGGLMNAHSAGIGGGAFIVFYNRTSGQAVAINARETAPAAASQDMFVSNPLLSTFGEGSGHRGAGGAEGLVAAAPGSWADLPWRDLLTPTIEPVSVWGTTNQSSVSSCSGKKNFLFDSKKEVVPPGTLIRREKLAHTLHIIADEGVGAFYNGTLSQMIVDDIRDNNGTITREDLADYTVDVASPFTFNVSSSGLRVYSMPLPGSGVVLGYIFNILSGYGFTADSMSTTDKAVLTYHRIVEAMKFAYAKRSELGDPKFLNISQVVLNMTSPEVGQEIRAKISDDHTHDIPYYEPSFFNKNEQGTSHLSVLDGEGNAVAITTTINLQFGSKMIGYRTGIIFNNEMDDFSTPNTINAFGVPASPANFIQPGKRPLSSMSPSVFVDSKQERSNWWLTAIRTLWLNNSLVEAVEDSRVHHQLFPPEIHVDPGFPKDVQDGLVAKGHRIATHIGSKVQAILKDGSRLYAVSDWRKGGAPDGY
ncbi:hypothetical protein C0Q70_08216 [Pomacea canaliculata]|uniref:Gamma-glutamyltransferase n=1 Tax=Pomacea canaliculata TaxID=400727 RepID=A0A2T7PHA4_POMCA|nr:hypothetical protein C0Q70_08216 [Pomacea canaliculata]